MPARATAPIGAPCWVDLMTSDTERSRAFYTRLFGWTAEDPNPELGGYFSFAKDGVLVAGCMASQTGTGMPDVWSVHLATDDAEKTVAAAAASGGTVHVPPMAVADLGTMAVIADPGQAAVGIWQPGTHAGFGVLSEHGAPSWFELLTRDHATCVAFYRDVFRWDTTVVSDTDDFRYTVLQHGEDWLAGVMDASSFLPEGAPAHWSVYFGVDDTDAAVAATLELGGSLITPAEDTEYGRVATVSDPTGAAFKLVAPNESMPAKA